MSVMSDSEAKAILLHEDIIIPSCGTKRAGDIVTREEAGCSFQWLFDNQFGEPCDPDAKVKPVLPVKAEEVVVAEVDSDGESDDSDDESDGSDEESTESQSDTEQPVASEADAEVIGILRTVLTEGKLQLKTILSQTGLTEEAVVPVLTEANGFKKNQQGWFSNI